MNDAVIIWTSEAVKRLYRGGGSLARRIADRMCDDMEAAGVTEADLERLGIISATGVSADPGGTETKPEQNLHEKGSEG